MLKYDSDNTESRKKTVTPNAYALVEGLRDFGYNLETAVADIIDNSISAGARNVEINTCTETDNPWIAIVDDGIGMSETELVDAMRLGSKNPRDCRPINDLGRFGLGLKSASFSQCRVLTVFTSRDGESSCARWDLDHIARNNEWELELLDNFLLEEENRLRSNSGTVVKWQNLDRLSGGLEGYREKKIKHINSELVKAEHHLSLVFHRYLEGTNPTLNIKLNGRKIVPIDPMASSHPATQKDPEETIPLANGTVTIHCHTLPHHKKMSQNEWDELGGQKGHLRTQGIYVYREKRLIIAGSWLGLAKQKELTKLCRIAINIPNTMDNDWKIDVKKASAQLPPLVRDRLKKIIERLVGTSKRTYTRRGGRLVEQTPYPIWKRIKSDDKVIFRPNLDHPIFTTYADKLPEDLRPGFKQCLKFIGTGLPVDTLYSEFASNGEAVVSDDMEDYDLKELVFAIAEALQKNGFEKEAISEALQSHPSLQKNWESAKGYLTNYFMKNKHE